MRWLRDLRGDDQSRSSSHVALVADIENAVSSDDAQRAWGATWDLIAANDYLARSRALAMLQPFIAAAYAPPQTPVVTDTRADTRAGIRTDVADLTANARDLTLWKRAELALALVETIEEAADPNKPRTLRSREVLKHHDAEQTRKFQQSLANAGVRPGEGLPAWMLYMSRRKKKRWG